MKLSGGKLQWFGVTGVTAAAAIAGIPGGSAPPEASPARALHRTSGIRLPLTFEANRGQFAREIRFAARLQGGSVALKTDGASIVTREGTVDLRLGTPSRVRGVARAPGHINYLVGSRPDAWIRGVPSFGEVVYEDVRPGVDVRFHTRRASLEYDVIVEPGADPNQVAFPVEGARKLDVDKDGALSISLPTGQVRQPPPLAFQWEGGVRREIESEYVLRDRAFGFRLGPYDRDKALVIDPVVPLSASYLGGRFADLATDVDAGSDGSIYVTGGTDSPDFPLQGALDDDWDFADGYDCTGGTGCHEGFVAKLNPDASALVYATYLGGSAYDHGRAVRVDSSGAAYVTGRTASHDFPTTTGTYSSIARGGGDAFVAKLAPSGETLEYSTYLGGERREDPVGLDIDESGRAYVAGNTESKDFPVTPGAVRSSCLDDETQYACEGSLFVTRLSPTGASLDYSAHIGTGESVLTQAQAMATDPEGGVYLVGKTAVDTFPVTPGAFQTTRTDLSGADGFVLKLAEGGTRIAFGTYLGAERGSERILDIDVDASGTAYLVGETTSERFPVTPDGFDLECEEEETGADEDDCHTSSDAFISKLSSDGSQLLYSTFFGERDRQTATNVAVDANGRIVVAGNGIVPLREPAQSRPPRTNRGCKVGLWPQGCSTGFLARFEQDGSLSYSTLYGSRLPSGGSNYQGHPLYGGLAVGSAGTAYLAATTTSTHLATDGAYDTTCGVLGDDACDETEGDVLVAKLDYVAATRPCGRNAAVVTAFTSEGPLRVDRVGDSIRSMDGNVASTCDGATVLNVSQLNILGSNDDDAVTLDLRGGPFTPGNEPANEGAPAIATSIELAGGNDELTIQGGARDERLEISPRLGDHSGDYRFDLVPSGVERFVLDGGGGDDDLFTWEGDLNILVRGGPGRDHLQGWGWTRNAFDAADGEPDVVDCAGGDDFVRADSVDTLNECEVVETSVSPPETGIESGPLGTTPATSAEFSFAVTKDGTRAECALDGGSFEPCNAPVRYEDLETGQHVFHVRAVDVFGTRDPTPADRTWRVSNRSVDDDPILLAAGDIADCVPGDTGELKTATIIGGFPQATVAALGDLAYPDGTPEQFQNCYEPSWGQHKARTWPTPGNHEYRTTGASGYFDYFGARAGPVGKGWYSYDLGSWHVVVLNSNCTDGIGCSVDSEQLEWLRDDLDAHPVDCTLAYWHHPLFTSGTHQNDSDLQFVRPFWDALYARGVEVILVGHDHDYERFAPQTPAGAADATYGIRQFVVGTGGANLRTFGSTRPNSEVREATTYGVLKLTLSSGSYAWEFLSEPGKPFTDTGTGNCHDSHDSIPPEINPTITSTHPSNWTNDDTVDVMWSGASDSGSGVNGFSYSWTQSETSDPGTTKMVEENVGSATSPLPDGESWFHLRTVDNAGNWSDTVHHGPYQIDTIAPSTTDNAPAGWRSTAVTVTLTPHDAHSGVASTQYRVDGGAPQTGTSVVVPAPSDGSNDGMHTVTYSSIDHVGNVEATRTATVRIDTTSPVTTDDAPTGWRRAPVTLTLHATDLHSGVATTSYRVNGGAFQTGTQVQLTTDGTHTVEYRSTDAAGNVEDLKTATVRIEHGPPINPSLDSPSHEPGSWSNNPTVEVTWAGADDELSGVDGYSVAWAQSATAPVDEMKNREETADSETSTRPDGDWWFLLRTVDNAGNWSDAVAIGPFRIETGPPETVIASGPPSATHSTSASFALLSESGSSFECSLDGSPFAPCSSPSNYNGLGYGAHLFQARAVDQASNRDSTPAEWRWTIVAAPPPPPPPPPPTPPPPPPPPADSPPKRPPRVARCVVPRVIGRTTRRARIMIERAGCRMGRVRRTYSHRARKGFVLTQGPRAGRRLPRGSRVGMVVSRGKKPTPRRR